MGSEQDRANLVEHPGDPLAIFHHIVQTFAVGMDRVSRARFTIATARLVVLRHAVLTLDGHLPGPTSTPEVQPILDDLAMVSPRDLDDYSYVANVSTLVYATTVFDTLLQDVLELLLFMYPGSVGRQATVDFTAILSAKSKMALVEDTIRAKVRALGFESFAERLAFLRKQFGLKVALSDKTEEQVAHFASVRNTMVHDQGYFDLCLTDAGQIGMLRRACVRHPTPISHADTHGAIKAYSTVALALATEIAATALKGTVSETLVSRLVALSAGTRPQATTSADPESPLGNGVA